jgi:hypothetical protein
MTDIRSQYRTLYRQARTQGLEGDSLYRAALALTGEPHGPFQGPIAARLYNAVTIARRAVEPMREKLARDVLNCWGHGNPYRCPPMDSPRFPSWQHGTQRADALRKRLVAAGRVELDAGNWVVRVIAPAASASPSERKRLATAKRARRMIATYRANAQAMRQTAAESTAGLAQAIAERNAARAELASLQRSLADPSNPIRATDAVRLIDEARELRAKVASLTAHNAQMKAMCERGSDQLEQMIGRVTRAESILRQAGLMPAPIVVEAPGAIAA